ncbi:hypothetical protein MVEN_02356100 [Mycena venus]|uniref:Uncharacterized protein n=1 Tax=Mycena venus TaxID=2733690 RepID=A0A8H7CFD0_9AGAR|nr:hypothetical protein MVEN_02356100 [Mycena venus]
MDNFQIVDSGNAVRFIEVPFSASNQSFAQALVNHSTMFTLGAYKFIPSYDSMLSIISDTVVRESAVPGSEPLTPDQVSHLGHETAVIKGGLKVWMHNHTSCAARASEVKDGSSRLFEIFNKKKVTRPLRATEEAIRCGYGELNEEFEAKRAAEAASEQEVRVLNGNFGSPGAASPFLTIFAISLNDSTDTNWLG